MRELTLERSHLPGKTLEGAVEFLGGLHWHLGLSEKEGLFYLRTGETLVLKTDSRDVVDAFIYGLALASCTLPEPIFKEYQDYLLRHFGEARPIPRLDSGL